MKEIIKNKPNFPSDMAFMAELEERTLQISDADMAALKKAIKPEWQDCAISTEMAYIHSLPANEIEIILRQCEELGDAPGPHDIKRMIYNLADLTDDPKYDFIREKAKNQKSKIIFTKKPIRKN